jgi:hypothetical protein
VYRILNKKAIRLNPISTPSPRSARLVSIPQEPGAEKKQSRKVTS